MPIPEYQITHNLQTHPLPPKYIDNYIQPSPKEFSVEII